MTLVGGMQGHAPCKILLLQQSLLLCQLNFMEIIRPITMLRCISPLSVFLNFTEFRKSGVTACLVVVLGIATCLKTRGLQ